MFTKKNQSMTNLQRLTLAAGIALLSPQLAYAIEIDPKKCEEASKNCEEKSMSAWRNHGWFGENADDYATMAMHKCLEIKNECLKDANVKGAPKGK